MIPIDCLEEAASLEGELDRDPPGDECEHDSLPPLMSEQRSRTSSTVALGLLLATDPTDFVLQSEEGAAHLGSLGGEGAAGSGSGSGFLSGSSVGSIGLALAQRSFSFGASAFWRRSAPVPSFRCVSGDSSDYRSGEVFVNLA